MCYNVFEFVGTDCLLDAIQTSATVFEFFQYNSGVTMFGKVFLVLYVIVQIFISVLTEYSIKNHRYFSRFGSKTRVIRILIYAFLAAVPILGAFLPKCGFKYFCMELGNIWLGFFIFCFIGWVWEVSLHLVKD